jgi:hypothetical protein
MSSLADWLDSAGDSRTLRIIGKSFHRILVEVVWVAVDAIRITK